MCLERLKGDSLGDDFHSAHVADWLWHAALCVFWDFSIEAISWRPVTLSYFSILHFFLTTCYGGKPANLRCLTKENPLIASKYRQVLFQDGIRLPRSMGVVTLKALYQENCLDTEREPIPPSSAEEPEASDGPSAVHPTTLAISNDNNQGDLRKLVT